MTTFAILTPPDNPSLSALETALGRVFPSAFHRIAPGQYVATKSRATSEEVAKAMGANGEIGLFAVFVTAGHFGWHNKNLWEWLSVKASA